MGGGHRGHGQLVRQAALFITKLIMNIKRKIWAAMNARSYLSSPTKQSKNEVWDATCLPHNIIKHHCFLPRPRPATPSLDKGKVFVHGNQCSSLTRPPCCPAAVTSSLPSDLPAPDPDPTDESSAVCPPSLPRILKGYEPCFEKTLKHIISCRNHAKCSRVMKQLARE